MVNRTFFDLIWLNFTITVSYTLLLAASLIATGQSCRAATLLLAASLIAAGKVAGQQLYYWQSL